MTESARPPALFPLPPTSEEERIAWLRLLRSRRVGPSTFHRLLATHGSAGAALDALPGVARTAGVKDYTPCSAAAAMNELAAGRAAGARPVFFGEPAYPALLCDIPDPPPVLWAAGDTDLTQRPVTALVGARNASSLGLRMARQLATELGKADHVIVSGLARGIDTAAHLAALDTGTIAVMAGGIDVMYPAENAHLATEIAKRGLLLSEQPVGMTPQARHFPARNRIISGLASATVVVEAAAKSGSLITARAALDQGREVLAVPGHPFDARATGCNALIRDGAPLVRGAGDVIEALSPGGHARRAPELAAEPQPAASVTRGLSRTAELHGRILDRLGPSPLAEDQLIRDLAAPAERVAPLLTDLELEGRIIRHPGGLVSLSVRPSS